MLPNNNNNNNNKTKIKLEIEKLKIEGVRINQRKCSSQRWEVDEIYSNRNQENLSVVFTCFKDDWNINLFLFSSKWESPYKNNVILLLSVIDSKLLQMEFTLFIR